MDNQQWKERSPRYTLPDRTPPPPRKRRGGVFFMFALALAVLFLSKANFNRIPVPLSPPSSVTQPQPLAPLPQPQPGEWERLVARLAEGQWGSELSDIITLTAEHYRSTGGSREAELLELLAVGASPSQYPDELLEQLCTDREQQDLCRLAIAGSYLGRLHGQQSAMGQVTVTLADAALPTQEYQWVFSHSDHLLRFSSDGFFPEEQASSSSQMVFLDYSIPGGEPEMGETLSADIAAAKAAGAQLVVVGLHWGNSYPTLPTHYQQRSCHQAVDAGAGLVIGYAPDAPQGIQRYKGTDIIYSINGYIYRQSFSLAPGEAPVPQPALIIPTTDGENDSAPKPVFGSEATDIRNELLLRSGSLDGGITAIDLLSD